MKIAIDVSQGVDMSGSAAQDRALERDILAAKSGDWQAKQNLVKVFTPLINSLASKRGSDAAQVAAYVAAGKVGTMVAAGRYRSGQGSHNFRLAAAACIEAAMDKVSKPSFFKRLFGGRR
jgi:hypothetical protein